ncbi:hypothetical protein [Dysgonomonas sp. PH5-37]|uniref:hypothetical protein n=1 Tax=Dysgonomonas sp. PH5-37 TaxID=2940648 RepID=UPI0024750D62|nr:hypothetical protein [Dysgonomonas sp. PH5-37]
MLCINVFLIQKVLSNDGYNYITSGYYQLVNEAYLAYLEDNEDLAFLKLQQAEKACPIVEQTEYGEMSLYARLLIKNNDYDKAVHYINKLATDYGSIALFLAEEDTTDYIMKFKESIDLHGLIMDIYPKFQAFYTPERKDLINELRQMHENDQKIREDANNKIENPTLDWDEVSQHNADRIIEILKIHGYTNYRVTGVMNGDLGNSFWVPIIHASDIREEIEPMIWRYVETGECTPYVWAFMRERKTGKYIYEVLNCNKENKIDIEEVNKNRLSIGLPTLDMQEKISSLKKKRNKR